MIGMKVGKELVIDQCFTEQQCDEILHFGGDWFEGTVQKFNVSMTDREHRSVLLSKNNLPEDLIESIFFKVFQLNKQTFRYHIEGFEMHDLPRIYKYSADRSDHYVWHRDTLLIPNKSCRKLSFSIQLTDPSEYDGGELEFIPELKDSMMKRKGNIVVFPSYLAHRVTPMTRGVRHAIVGFIHGPEFR